jgi:uncharacterized membrane protein YhaH (DUF805 family)
MDAYLADQAERNPPASETDHTIELKRQVQLSRTIQDLAEIVGFGPSPEPWTGFKGRADRGEYWRILAASAALIGLELAFAYTLAARGISGIEALAPFLIAIPGIWLLFVAIIRRLHDLNLGSGWIIVWAIGWRIVAAGLHIAGQPREVTAAAAGGLGLISLIVLGALKSASSDNRFGPVPTGPRHWRGSADA